MTPVPEPLARASALQGILAAAQGLVDGRLDCLKAAAEIARLRHDLDPDQEDPDLLAFAGIDSQVDEVLIADSLKGWSPALKAQKAAEYAEAERFFRPGALESARALLAHYGRSA